MILYRFLIFIFFLRIVSRKIESPPYLSYSLLYLRCSIPQGWVQRVEINMIWGCWTIGESPPYLSCSLLYIR